MPEHLNQLFLVSDKVTKKLCRKIVEAIQKKTRKISAYWICQLSGWGSYVLLNLFFYFTIRTKSSPYFFQAILLDAVVGLILTHIMRFFYTSTNLLNLEIRKQIFYIVGAILIFSFLFSYSVVLANVSFNWESEMMQEYSFWPKVFRSIFGYFLFLLIWNFIYFAYHYVEKSRNEKMDKIRLEALVKTLELKTIKSHINPHFIFNALNSIRALVDENPERARTAITELSNILRSSMQAEKVETTSLEKELNIVRDYLELEHIRFEDRLNVQYDIEQETLDQQVPPMMLQTLVENAIKHGISQQLNGGWIKIHSLYRDNRHELIVQNTGKLAPFKDLGFGISSTKNRLQLLFGDKANFSISNVNGNTVQAKVIMPILNN